MKYEMRHKNRLSVHLIDDANAAKIIYDKNKDQEFLNLQFKKNKISGFLHEIGANPFGFLIIAEFMVI